MVYQDTKYNYYYSYQPSVDSFYAYDFSNPNIYYDYNKNYYGNITYNVPTQYEPPIFKPYKPSKRRVYQVGKYAAGKLTEDGLQYILNSRRKPTFDLQYAQDMAKGYLHGQAVSGLIKVGGKFVSKPVTIVAEAVLETNTFSQCILSEVDYLKGNNLFNKSNLKLTHARCMAESGLHLITSKSITDTMLKSAFKVGMRETIDHLYQPTKFDSFTDKISNAMTNVLYNYVEQPALKGVTFVVGPVDRGVDFLLDYGIHQGEIAFHKIQDYLRDSPVDEAYQYLLDKGELAFDNIHDYFTNNQDTNPPALEYDASSSPAREYDWTDPEFGYQPPETPLFEDTNQLDISTNVNPNIPPDENQSQVEKLDNFGKAQLGKLMDNLQKIGKFVSLCNLIKNFRDMTDAQRIMELQCFLVSLKSTDSMVNGIFRFCAELVESGKITKENVLNLAAAIAEKYLNIPLVNAFQFVKNLVQGKSVKDYIIPLAVDIASMMVPVVGIINMVNNILKGIDALLTKQEIKEIGGISAVYTDKYKVFKRKHKIKLDNDFFDIHICYHSKHARDAKRWAESEFKKQLDHKVYQVLGIPIEYLNNTYIKRTTRFGKYAERYYLQDLENKWLEVNEKHLTAYEKKLIESMYFENEKDKEYRYALAKKGESPSWFWHHKHDSVFQFTQDIFEMLEKDMEKYDWSIHSFRDLSKFARQIIEMSEKLYHKLFDNGKIKADDDLGKTEEEKRNKAFEKARDKRKEQEFFKSGIMVAVTKWLAHTFPLFRRLIKNTIFEKVILVDDDYKTDNEILDEYRDATRKDYQKLTGMYSREVIIHRAMLELWNTQKSVEYFIQTGYSTYCGFVAQYISFIDMEINEMMARPVNYPFRMIRQYTGNFVQSYITRVITEQVNLWVSLLERTEQMTDEFLANYINPTIGCLVGIGIGFFRYITTWDKSKKPFKGVVTSSAMSAVNCSLGLIYTYIKTTYLGAVFETSIWSECMDNAVWLIKKVMGITLTVDFVSTVMFGVLINVGYRVGSAIWNRYFNAYKQLNLYTPTFSDLEGNPIVSDLEKNSFSNLESSPCHSNLENTKTNANLLSEPVESDISRSLNKYGNILNALEDGNQEYHDFKSDSTFKSMKFQKYEFKKYEFKKYEFQKYEFKKYKFKKFEVKKFNFQGLKI